MLALSFSYFTLQLCYVWNWNTLPLWKNPKEKLTTTHISVVISARNEAENIVRCLQSIATQNYPTALFEIILIDDHSEDETLARAKELQISNLRTLRLQDYLLTSEKINAYKKKAIEVGIDQAVGKLIVCTDADCRVGKEWLRQIALCYEKTNAKMIVGPVLFEDEQSLFQRFQSLDFLGMMAITGAGINGRFLYMCNGANLAYPKAVFEELEGFKGIDTLASGDDVLFLQKVAMHYPKDIRYLKANEAVVFTTPMRTLRSFIRQRVRWASKSGSYSTRLLSGWGTQLQLALVWLFSLSIVSSFLLIPFWGLNIFWLWFIQFIMKGYADYWLLSSAAKFFKRPDLMRVFVPSLFLHCWYIVWVGFLGMLPKRYIWKGRGVK